MHSQQQTANSWSGQQTTDSRQRTRASPCQNRTTFRSHHLNPRGGLGSATDACKPRPSVFSCPPPHSQLTLTPPAPARLPSTKNRLRLWILPRKSHDSKLKHAGIRKTPWSPPPPPPKPHTQITSLPVANMSPLPLYPCVVKRANCQVHAAPKPSCSMRSSRDAASFPSVLLIGTLASTSVPPSASTDRLSPRAGRKPPSFPLRDGCRRHFQHG
ncbi:hypothetical protein B0H67DRAFT_388569 [Lasiosphaeris hirsuta]|uniref:Uncharacterized protein n=1 Tax=Lasiosphaeris hirsuta TaxID=260670 RepID=A0AA39ZXV4_9PEZI|nr:hypothetical protein B0H67DRAFT_388569 [Lasiosphaeris hirsuta]